MKRFSNPKNGLEWWKKSLSVLFLFFFFLQVSLLFENISRPWKIVFWTPVLNPQISHIHSVCLACTAKLDFLQSPQKD